MKVRFIIGFAVGALAGMVLMDNCPKAQKVMDEGKYEASRAVKEIRRSIKKLGRKLHLG